jgi:hypothetical protein
LRRSWITAATAATGCRPAAAASDNVLAPAAEAADQSAKAA